MGQDGWILLCSWRHWFGWTSTSDRSMKKRSLPLSNHTELTSSVNSKNIQTKFLHVDFFHLLLCESTLCELSRSSTPIRSSSWPFSGENQVLLRFRIRQQNCSIIRGVDIDFIVSQTSKLSLTTHLFHEKPQDLPQSDVSLFLNAVNGLYFGIMNTPVRMRKDIECNFEVYGTDW